MKPRVALSMIVRDAELDLPRCLDSVAGLVDEIVIADTGSLDGTRAIADRYQARCLQIPWEHDFAKARNQALAAVTADWVLALDADEQMDPDAGELLPALLAHAEVTGYLVTIRNYVKGINERLWDKPATPNDFRLETARSYPAYTEHENVRLFRRHPDVYFVGRVHETVGHRITESGGRLAPANFLIHHFGMVASPQTCSRKQALYQELGRLKVAEMPHSGQAHFELGLVEFDSFSNYEEALRCFHRACELNPKLEVSWLFAALAAIRLERHADALRYTRGAAAHGHCGPLLLEVEGDAHFNLGNYPEAERVYRKALKTSPEPVSLESKLGMAELRRGETESALRRLRRTLRERRQTPELHDRLIAALTSLGRLEEAAAAAEDKLTAIEPDETAYMRAASIRARIGHWEKAEASVTAGLNRFPQSDKLRRALLEVQAGSGRVPQMTGDLGHGTSAVAP